LLLSVIIVIGSWGKHKLKCPVCANFEDKVLETRQVADGTSVRRRRRCLSCGYRFTSYEVIEEKQLMIVKNDGRREPFSIEKISYGIKKATEKRKISLSVVENLISDIEEEAIFKSGETHELRSKDLGEIVMEKLSEIDEVAYIRFASVYKKFNDLDEFIIEIKKIKKSLGRGNVKQKSGKLE